MAADENNNQTLHRLIDALDFVTDYGWKASRYNFFKRSALSFVNSALAPKAVAHITNSSNLITANDTLAADSREPSCVTCDSTSSLSQSRADSDSHGDTQIINSLSKNSNSRTPSTLQLSRSTSTPRISKKSHPYVAKDMDTFFDLIYHLAQLGLTAFLKTLRDFLDQAIENEAEQEQTLRAFMQTIWAGVIYCERTQFSFNREVSTSLDQCHLRQDVQQFKPVVFSLNILTQDLKLDIKSNTHRRIIDEMYRVAAEEYIKQHLAKNSLNKNEYKAIYEQRTKALDEVGKKAIETALADQDTELFRLVHRLIHSHDSDLPNNPTLGLIQHRQEMRKIVDNFNQLAEEFDLPLRINADPSDRVKPQAAKRFGRYWLNENATENTVKKSSPGWFKRNRSQLSNFLLYATPLAATESIVFVVSTLSAAFLPLVAPLFIFNAYVLYKLIKKARENVFQSTHIHSQAGLPIYKDKKNKCFYYKDEEGDYYLCDRFGNQLKKQAEYTRNADNGYYTASSGATVANLQLLFKPYQRCKVFTDHRDCEVNKKARVAIYSSPILGLGLAAAMTTALYKPLLIFLAAVSLSSPIGAAIWAGVIGIGLTVLFGCYISQLAKVGLYDKFKYKFNIWPPYWYELTFKDKVSYIAKRCFSAIHGHSGWSQLTLKEKYTHMAWRGFKGLGYIILIVGTVGLFLFAKFGAMNYRNFQHSAAQFITIIKQKFATSDIGHKLITAIAAIGTTLESFFETVGLSLAFPAKLFSRSFWNKKHNMTGKIKELRNGNITQVRSTFNRVNEAILSAAVVSAVAVQAGTVYRSSFLRNAATIALAEQRTNLGDSSDTSKLTIWQQLLQAINQFKRGCRVESIYVSNVEGDQVDLIEQLNELTQLVANNLNLLEKINYKPKQSSTPKFTSSDVTALSKIEDKLDEVYTNISDCQDQYVTKMQKLMQKALDSIEPIMDAGMIPFCTDKTTVPINIPRINTPRVGMMGHDANHMMIEEYCSPSPS